LGKTIGLLKKLLSYPNPLRLFVGVAGLLGAEGFKVISSFSKTDLG
jgi:hypothetical protein